MMNQHPKEMKKLFKVLDIINRIDEEKMKREANKN